MVFLGLRNEEKHVESSGKMNNTVRGQRCQRDESLVFHCMMPTIIWIKNHSCILGQEKAILLVLGDKENATKKEESPPVLCQEHRNSLCVFRFLLGMHISLTTVKEADVSKVVLQVNDPSISDILQR